MNLLVMPFFMLLLLCTFAGWVDNLILNGQIEGILQVSFKSSLTES
jgi:hypothetical protein